MKGSFHWPLRYVIITQKFGQNRACVPVMGGKVIPCDGTNPPNGYRSLYGAKGHTGIDMRAGHGTEVYAAQRGRVVHIDTDRRSGLDVRIEHTIGGQKYRTIYEHLLGYQPKVGDWVETGQLIGWADNTGYSSGDHLHFQLEKWENKMWVPIDPEPLMSDMTALEALKVINYLKYLAEQVARLADNLASYLRKTKAY